MIEESHLPISCNFVLFETLKLRVPVFLRRKTIALLDQLHRCRVYANGLAEVDRILKPQIVWHTKEMNSIWADRSSINHLIEASLIDSTLNSTPNRWIYRWVYQLNEFHCAASWKRKSFSNSHLFTFKSYLNRKSSTLNTLFLRKSFFFIVQSPSLRI